MNGYFDRVPMDCSAENVNPLNKRPKEDSLRPNRDPEGDVLKKPKVQKQVRFADDTDIDTIVEGIEECALGYDRSKSARDHGWVLRTGEHEKLAIHPKALRTMPDEDLVHFASACPHFTYLSLSDGKHITDKGMFGLLTGRSHMRAIDISVCPNITDKTLLILGNCCPFLQECSILKCPITDCGIATLVTQCKDLRTISLDWCEAITDRSLFAIARHCPLLTHLCLTEGTQFSLSALRAVLQSCPWLETVDLWSCTQATDAWVDTIIEWGHNIKALDLKYCDKISPQAIARLKAHFSRLNLTH
ncbi:MAG: hypothetical protein JSS12_02450 [Verrucomicrobia bacterium]|nr:hypothetical protein [Verrucomicrobiota bacterium]